MKEYVHMLSDIPKGEFWAVLTQKSTYIPGDERSRTNPGHGYSATTEYSFDLHAFNTQEELNAWLSKFVSRYDHSYRVFKMTSFEVEKLVSFKISKQENKV